MRSAKFTSCFFVFLFCSLIMGTAMASDKKSEKDGMEYVELDPLILPIIDEDGVYQVLSMVVVIEVEGVFAADEIKKKSPKLKDAYIQDMYGVLNEHAAMKGGVLQVSIIKQRLNNITHAVMGDDMNTEVLLQMVQQRPI